jgi:hypothetical protein
MRFRKVIPCDPESIVQVTNCVSTKDMIRDQFNGKVVTLSTGSDSRSFDFPDGKVDFDAPGISEAPDLIEQSFMKDKFYEHLHPQKPAEPTPPVPPVAPTQDPE